MLAWQYMARAAIGSMRVCQPGIGPKPHSPRAAYHYCIPAKIMAGPLVRDEDPDEVDAQSLLNGG